MACGTGKTLTSLWVAEALAAERTLVLVPSLSLLRQFRTEWLEAAGGDAALLDLCVCSDVTVAGGRRGRVDELEERAADLGVPVTTDPATIAAFLVGSGRRVVFATYQSSPQIATAMSDQSVPAFDLVVADEAHRLVAGTDRAFATVLDERRLRARRRLFATATPRYLAAHVKRRAEEENIEVVSMDDRTVFGDVAHRLTFGQAISQDLLCDYRVVIMVTADSEVAELIKNRRLLGTPEAPVVDAMTLATISGVVRAVEEFGLHRLISLHRTVERARSFAAFVDSGSSDRVPRIDAVHVSGEMTAGDRSARLDRLRRGDDRPALIANARCLTEGVDIPALDGVVFVDPKWSPIDIVQAVGRVMRKAAGKNTGTIVIPVVVTDGTNAGAVLEESVFEIVWSVVRALRSHDERLADVLMDARTELGRRGRLPTSAFLRDRFMVVDLPRAIDADAFREAISLRIVDAGSLGFDEAVGRLLAFAEIHKHARVPQSQRELDGFGLGSWVNNRRNDQRAGRLPLEQIERIEAVQGWTWDPHDDAFTDGVAHLRLFAAENGHTLVPMGYRSPDGFTLGPMGRHQTDGTSRRHPRYCSCSRATSAPWLVVGAPGRGIRTRSGRASGLRAQQRPHAGPYEVPQPDRLQTGNVGLHPASGLPHGQDLTGTYRRARGDRRLDLECIAWSTQKVRPRSPEADRSSGSERKRRTGSQRLVRRQPGSADHSRRDFERDFGIADTIKLPAKSAEVRRAELKAERIAAKIGPTQAPKMTTLFGGYIGLPPARGRAVYRLLSAWAHGKQWKGITAKFEVVEGAVAVPGGKLVKVTANDDLSLNLTTLGMMTATRALNELDAYCGGTG